MVYNCNLKLLIFLQSNHSIINRQNHNSLMKEYIIYALKGMAVGLANIIPGVSGGTIALITGIFERLINSIKSFGLASTKLLLGGKFKEFAKVTDLYFLVSLFTGVIL